jgi:nucleotidyltransferase/DNA polymerase involved in DNA repair
MKGETMDDKARAQEMYGQFAGKAIETMTVWAEINQRVLGDLVELGAGTAKEGMRLYSELSRNAIEAVKEGQATALRWQASLSEASCDPAAWYQKTLAESVSGAQQAFRRVEENAQVLTRAAERLQATAEQAGKGMQESLAGAVSKMKEIYASN